MNSNYLDLRTFKILNKTKSSIFNLDQIESDILSKLKKFQ